MELVGKQGFVTSRVQGSDCGEVMISVRNGTERYYAVAEDPEANYAPNTRVVVVDELGGRTLVVSDQF